jgi:hypothetical protein
MRIIARDNAQACYSHFCRQAGLSGGGPPVFSGVRFQRGSGLISNFSRGAIPYFAPILKHAALGAGRYLLGKGGDFLSALESGENFKTAAKQKFGEIKRDFLDTVLRRKSQKGSGRKKKKKKGKKKRAAVGTISARFPHYKGQSGGRRRTVSKRKKTSKKKGKKKRLKSENDIFQ